MPVMVGEVMNGLTSIVWKTKVKHVAQYHTNEKVQLNRFYPCAAYIVTCHLYSKPVNYKKNTYEIELYLIWHRQSTMLSGGESGKPENHHRPFAIWGSVDGSEKFKLEQSRGGGKKEWTSGLIPFKFSLYSTLENSLALTCKFWIEFETFTRSEKNALKHVKNLYVQQSNCNVKFSFKEREQLGAHSTILAARSPVFAAMFQHNMKEAITGEVDIEDIQLDIFDQLLHYIYSGRMSKPMTEASAQLLYAAADKYDIADLKKDCVKFLLSCVRVDNVLNLMIWSHNFSIAKAKEATVAFAARHGKEICKLESWEKLTRNYPELSVLATRRMMGNMFTFPFKSV